MDEPLIKKEKLNLQKDFQILHSKKKSSTKNRISFGKWIQMFWNPNEYKENIQMLEEILRPEKSK